MRVLSFTFIRVDDTAVSVESNEGRRKHPVDLRFRFISNGKPPLFLRAQDCRRRLSAVVDDFDFRKLPSDVRLLPVNPRCYYYYYFFLMIIVVCFICCIEKKERYMNNFYYYIRIIKIK